MRVLNDNLKVAVRACVQCGMVMLFCFVATGLNAHPGGVNANGCHTPGGADSGNPCHCHLGDDRAQELACENGAPVVDDEDDADEDATMWKGVVVAEEERCSDYDGDLYAYGSRSDITVALDYGGLYAPYEDRCFYDYRDVDVEHIVARSEAHDSGMCGADHRTRLLYSSDLDNLTVASPRVNRELKGPHDAAGWVPDHNKCWFANRVLTVKRRYKMTIDPAERDALKAILDECSFNDIELKVPEDCEAPDF